MEGEGEEAVVGAGTPSGSGDWVAVGDGDGAAVASGAGEEGLVAVGEALGEGSTAPAGLARPGPARRDTAKSATPTRFGR